jgi:hypothetical protein
MPLLQGLAGSGIVAHSLLLRFAVFALYVE